MNPILIDVPEIFESERLTIRAPKPGDGAELHTAVEETYDDLKAWMPWAKERQTVEDLETFVRNSCAEFISRKNLFMLLFLKGTGTLVGGSGLHGINWNIPCFEIGYWCRERFQGQGYITESTAAITKFAFETLGAKRVEIRCDSQNVKSRRVPERLGFRLEATLKNSVLSTSGEVRDGLIFAKTNEDWVKETGCS